MKRAIKIFRVLLVAVLFVAIGLPVIGYMVFSTDWAELRLQNAGQEALSKLLDTQVSIGQVKFKPFNRIKLLDVEVADDYGQPAMRISTLEARFEVGDLLMRRKIIIDYVVLDSLKVSVYRQSQDSVLNINNIIAKLTPKEKKSDNGIITLRLNDLQINDAQLAYNVLDAEQTPGRFNPAHICISDFNCEVYVPRISKDAYDIRLEKFALKEQCGFQIEQIHGYAYLSPDSLSLYQMLVQLPNSTINLYDVSAPLPSITQLSQLGLTLPVELGIQDGSHVYLPDVGPIVPVMNDLKYDVNVAMRLSGLVDSLNIHQLSFSNSGDRTSGSVEGIVMGLPKLKELEIPQMQYRVQTAGYTLQSILSSLKIRLNPRVKEILRQNPSINISGSAHGSLLHAYATANCRTASGNIAIDAEASNLLEKYSEIGADLTIKDLRLGMLTGNRDLGPCSGEIAATINLNGSKHPTGDIAAELNEFTFKGYRYDNISAMASSLDSAITAEVMIDDPNISFKADASARKTSSGEYELALASEVSNADWDALNLYTRFPEHNFAANIKAHAVGRSLSTFKGNLAISDLSYVDTKHVGGLRIPKIELFADNREGFGVIDLNSFFLTGSLQGDYDLATVSKCLKNTIAQVFPSLMPQAEATEEREEQEDEEVKNEFSFDFVLTNAEDICEFFDFPVNIMDPVYISGEMSQARQTAWITLDAPWLLQGSNLIEDTYVSGMIDGAKGIADVYATTHYPTKKGPMDLIATIHGLDGILETNIDWQIVRDNPINGNINFSTLLSKNFNNGIAATIDIKPGQINFGNEVWSICPAKIQYDDNILRVDNFSLLAPTQSINISGMASSNDYDKLTVNLNNIHLQEIFETLDIDKALLCGDATATIVASKIFTKEPDIHSTKFFVKDIGYNRCVLGDGDLKVNYDVEDAAFCFKADIKGPQNNMSKITGKIRPATEELDFYFDADRVRVGFMQPFMEAFCSGIQGYASGKAHLFGTFKYIDLEGDIYADSLKLRIDFTNTWYTASDSIYIKPGKIDLKNITIYDAYGNTALLNGQVRHDFFKAPDFDFSVTQAHNFLCYDISQNDNPRWYGKIFGNGSAFVDGHPGVVNIGVTMTTAANSTFTFALLDSEDAEEYSFIVFRDATPVMVAQDYSDIKIKSKSVETARSMRAVEEAEIPTAYNMDIKVEITPLAQVNVVMDPVGGDAIRSHGAGQMHLTYGSVNGDLRLFGTYTLEQGEYNFTLQDIIIKDFKIRNGSSIAFNGDPYRGQLDINAIYSLNANLSDLDESFLQDKDLNRTNVPVYAVMKVTGDMTQPDIAFDLEFPTLSQDTYRKVRSIVSTEDMMNRQIIYLLALHRFYTPDYMASTTKGNELFSVASSTISSQLSSMLGKLSDNWSIAPNLRSDRGDFSDIEVDVTLSSSLLNNRLLFNGNFGYRDKSLNTNQFIGDFDIEYLLNRPGTLRLKAYNRYNDQNYYVRTAQTTQGVGIIVRHDFDDIFGFLRKKPKDKIATSDSIAVPMLPELEIIKIGTDSIPAEQ